MIDLDQPRKWDFIECGNHPEMYPGQLVPSQSARVLFSRHIPQHKKRRPKSEDTFNRWWEVAPWDHDRPGYRVPCTLSTRDRGIIDFALDRSRVEVIDRDLRSKCTLYNLYMRCGAALSMTPHQLIQESWKQYTVSPHSESPRFSHSESSNFYLDRFASNNELHRESTLATKFVSHYQVFLRDVQKRMIFDDVESLHFEEYRPNEATRVVIPCRFYGLDQWFPVNRDGFYQWRVWCLCS